MSVCLNRTWFKRRQIVWSFIHPLLFPEEEAVCVLWLSLSGICFRQPGEGCLGGALLCLHGLWDVLRPVLLQKLWPLQWVMHDVFPDWKFLQMSSKVNYYDSTIFSFNINIFHTLNTVWKHSLIIRYFGYLYHGPCTLASFLVCVWKITEHEMTIVTRNLQKI